MATTNVMQLGFLEALEGQKKRNSLTDASLKVINNALCDWNSGSPTLCTNFNVVPRLVSARWLVLGTKKTQLTICNVDVVTAAMPATLKCDC